MKNNIRVERAKKRMTQTDLASAVGTCKVNIGNIENGKTIPRLSLAMRIAKFFGKKVDEIFHEEEE